MENHEYQSQEDYITCIVLGHVMNNFELSLIKVHERTVLVFHTLSIPVDPLQVGIEVLAGLQGSSQHCCCWVDPRVLLRPAQEYSLRLTEGLQQPGKCWTRGGLRVPGKG